MKVLENRVFSGPNVYSLKPVIRLVVDIGDLEEKPTNVIPGFTDRLVGMIPSLEEHRCSEGVRGGFIQRLREGTWAGHVVEHVALELQCLVGTPVGYGRCRQSEKRGVYNVIYSYIEEKVGMQAGLSAVKIVEHLARDLPLDVEKELSVLKRIVDEVKYGPSTQAIIDKARERNIPVLRLSDENLVQLGHAQYQKRIQATVTSLTSLIATDIAGNKQLTKKLLDEVGIPIPKGKVVSHPDDALRAAREIGFPVVVKPLSANHGKGVAVNLKTEAEVDDAYDRARDFADKIIVERFVGGRDHRVLVVNGEVVAVSERVPAHVEGDGRRTVQELIDLENRNPLRGEGHEKPLTKIYVNQETRRCLQQQGLTLASVPKKGETVWLKLTANLSTGGIAVDRTDDIHPANVEMASRAVRIIGLDVAGVDMITTDITRPLWETGGTICEVNAAPGFRMHVHPSKGKPRDVAGAMLDMLFPPGNPSRIPIVAITGTNGKTTTARMVAHILKMAGHKVGLTTTDGLYVDGKRLLKGDLTGPWSARMILRDPTLDFAVLETARGGILRAGLGFDQCNIGVVTNVSEDHLGLRGVETIEDLAHVKSVLVEVVTPNGHAILNAEDPHVDLFVEHAKGEICYFALDPENERLKKHLESGGTGVTLMDHTVVLHKGGHVLPVMGIQDMPATFGGRAMFNTANAMVAALASFLSGVKVDDIRAGLMTFNTNFYLSPGRLNLEEVGEFHVLLDYAHNTAAYHNIASFIHMLHAERRVGVVTAPGDRRNSDIEEMGRIAARAFNRLIIREDVDLRGRSPGEIAGLFRQGALEAGLSPDAVEIVLNEAQAVEAALHQARKGDLIVITAAGNLEQTFDQVVKFRDRLTEASSRSR